MRRLLGVLTWSVVYFYASSVKIHNTWKMSVFDLSHWKDFINAWRSGKMVVDTPNEYALCAVLLLWIPVWLIGILVVLRLLRPKIPVANTVQKAMASHPFIPEYVPSNMPSQGKSVVIEPPPTESPESVSTVSNAEQSEPTEWVPKDTGEAHALEVITQIAEDNGLTPFPHVLLENELIPITISSDIDAFLIKVLAVQGQWQVGMTEPLEQSVWSCNGQTKPVLKEIVLGKSVLAKMEPESTVTPVVVLAKGSLENQNDVLPWLNQHGVEVVALPENQQQGIPQLSEVLLKYFGQTEEQE